MKKPLPQLGVPVITGFDFIEESGVPMIRLTFRACVTNNVSLYDDDPSEPSAWKSQWDVLYTADIGPESGGWNSLSADTDVTFDPIVVEANEELEEPQVWWSDDLHVVFPVDQSEGANVRFYRIKGTVQEKKW